ncbi:PP2C family protein-serine/threonine phosphatase, partial [Streptomyces violaceoruber]
MTRKDLGRIARSPEAAELLRRAGVHSYLVVPLIARGEVLGALDLKRISNPLPFDEDDLLLARELAARAALQIDNARWYQNARDTALTLQRSLLPPELPVIDGVEVEVIYRAAGEGNEVGGDFYDLFPISDDAYGFAIGDVCGTGPNAAAVTGLARHALRLLAREGLSGPAVLERLNSAILDEGARSRFLTLLYGEMRPQQDGSAELKVVCAGHP